ncbi:MAG: DUF4249 domain-containing protein [Ferruginibacter sp.]
MYIANSKYRFVFFIAFCKRLLFLVVVFISIYSCKKTFTSSQFVDDKLVVLAEITAGDSMEIPIGKTIKVGNSGLIRFEKVKEATVIIKDASSRSYTLLPNWRPQYLANPATVFTNRRYFRSNTTYFIEINHPTLGVVKATTHIPVTPKIIAIDTSAEIYQGKEVLAATITWQDDPTLENFYIIEGLKESVKLSRYFYYTGKRYNYDSQEGKVLYDRIKNIPGIELLKDTVPQNIFTRLNLFTEDINSANSSIGNLSNPFRRIFFTDLSFSGQNYKTKLYLDRQLFIDPQKKGRVRLQLKSASKELYDYLLVYEKYKTDFGTLPSSQLVSPVGNVQNGLGIFGGSSRRERIFYFDQL